MRFLAGGVFQRAVVYNVQHFLTPFFDKYFPKWMRDAYLFLLNQIQNLKLHKLADTKNSQTKPFQRWCPGKPEIELKSFYDRPIITKIGLLRQILMPNTIQLSDLMQESFVDPIYGEGPGRPDVLSKSYNNCATGAKIILLGQNLMANNIRGTRIDVCMIMSYSRVKVVSNRKYSLNPNIIELSSQKQGYQDRF